MAEISQQIQDLIKPSPLQIQKDTEMAHNRAKSYTLYKSSDQNSLNPNFKILGSDDKRSRSSSQSIQQLSYKKKRFVRKYFNGGSDPMSVDGRKATTFNTTATNSFSQMKQNQPDSQNNLLHAKTHSKISDAVPNQHFLTNDLDQCFDLDMTFLDNLSVSDSSVLKMLSDLGLDQGVNVVDVEKLVSQNQDYLHHVLSNCACFKCSCGRCRCSYAAMKLTYKNGFKTIYGKEFVKMDPTVPNITLNINQSHYETLSKIQSPNQIEPMKSTNQAFLKAHPLQQRYQRNYQRLQQSPFMATSTYQKNFHNWQDYDPNRIYCRPQHKSVCHEIPQQTQSMYSTDYGSNKFNIEPNISARDVKQKQAHKTYMNEYPNDNKIVYREAYKHLEGEPNRLKYKFQTETQQYHPVPSFENQFESVAKKSFHDPLPIKCPAQRMILIKKQNNKQLQKFMVEKIKELATRNKFINK